MAKKNNNTPIQEQIKVEVTFDLYYTKEELRQKAIDAAVSAIYEAPIYGANFTVRACDSKLIESKPIDTRNVEDCRHFDCAQGRNYCCNRKVNVPHCFGICDEYEENK